MNIIFILILVYDFFVNANEFIEENCKFRSENELKSYFEKNLEKYFYTLSIGFNHNPEMEFLMSNCILKSYDIKSKSKECSIIDNYELCPHSQINITRKDRFPFIITYSVCNCEKCLYKLNGRCTPITISKPVLYRTICDMDNYWKWKFGFEKIPIDCICI